MKQLFVRKSIPFIAILCIIITILTFIPAYSYASAAETESIQHIYDKADLLSTDEVSNLEQMCIEYGNEAGIDIIILTHNDSNAKEAEVYIEDFYDQKQYGDSVILLLDMYNRVVFIEGYGLAETYIHSKRIDVIISDITPSLSNGDYVTALDKYIKSSAAYMKDDSEINTDHDYSYDGPASANTDNDYNYDGSSSANTDNGYKSGYYDSSASTSNSVDSVLTNGWFQLLISLIVGGIAVGIMAYNAGGRMTTGGNTYMDSNQSGLIGRSDNYIRTSVTRIRRPTQNNNGRGGFSAGGFGGGISSGGSSHSSGGGKF